MTRPDAWAIRHHEHGWLVDACAGGTWSGTDTLELPNAEVDELAVTFETGTAAYQALDAADIAREGCEAVLLVLR